MTTTTRTTLHVKLFFPEGDANNVTWGRLREALADKLSEFGVVRAVRRGGHHDEEEDDGLFEEGVVVEENDDEEEEEDAIEGTTKSAPAPTTALPAFCTIRMDRLSEAMAAVEASANLMAVRCPSNAASRTSSEEEDDEDDEQGNNVDITHTQVTVLIKVTFPQQSASKTSTKGISRDVAVTITVGEEDAGNAFTLETIETLLRRRFLHCGRMTSVLASNLAARPHVDAVIKFERSSEAARAVEDFELRKGVSPILFCSSSSSHDTSTRAGKKTMKLEITSARLVPSHQLELAFQETRKKKRKNSSPGSKRMNVAQVSSSSSLNLESRKEGEETLVVEARRDGSLIVPNKRKHPTPPPHVSSSSSSSTSSSSSFPVTKKRPDDTSTQSEDNKRTREGSSTPLPQSLTEADGSPASRLPLEFSSPAADIIPAATTTSEVVDEHGVETLASGSAIPEEKELGESERPDSNRRSDGNNSNTRVLVVHSNRVKAESLAELFSSLPGFASIVVTRKKKTQAIRGVSFVTFASHEDAVGAIQTLNGSEFPRGSGNQLKLLFALSRNGSGGGESGPDAESEANLAMRHDGSPGMPPLVSPSNAEDEKSEEEDEYDESPLSHLEEGNETHDAREGEDDVISVPVSFVAESEKVGVAREPIAASSSSSSSASSSSSSVKQGNVAVAQQKLHHHVTPWIPTMSPPQPHYVQYGPSPPASRYVTPTNGGGAMPPGGYVYPSHPLSLPAAHSHHHFQQPPEYAYFTPSAPNQFIPSPYPAYFYAPHHNNMPPVPPPPPPPPPLEATNADALAEAFGNVMGFAGNHPPHQFQQHLPFSGGPHQRSPAPLNDASRLHVTFAHPLPESEVQAAFARAAPDLQYVSRHRDKLFAFVKYATAASALQAMVQLNGSLICGQRIRICLADPPPSSSGGEGTLPHLASVSSSSSSFVSAPSSSSSSFSSVTRKRQRNQPLASHGGSPHLPQQQQHEHNARGSTKHRPAAPPPSPHVDDVIPSAGEMNAKQE